MKTRKRPGKRQQKPLFKSNLSSRFIPESLRWLLSEKDHVRALRVLKRAARVNKVTLPENVAELLPRASDWGSEELEEKSSIHNFWHAFKTPNLRRHTIVMFYVW